jgi:hypothetical protein
MPKRTRPEAKALSIPQIRGHKVTWRGMIRSFECKAGVKWKLCGWRIVGGPGEFDGRSQGGNGALLGATFGGTRGFGGMMRQILEVRRVIFGGVLDIDLSKTAVFALSTWYLPASLY